MFYLYSEQNIGCNSFQYKKQRFLIKKFSTVATKILKDYEFLGQHNPEIVILIKKCLTEKKALLKKTKTGTVLVLNASGKQLDEMIKIKQTFHSYGYCNNIPLSLKMVKNKTNYYVRFETFAFKSFNELWAFTNELKKSYPLKLMTKWSEHPKDFHSIIIGGLLGDLNARRKGKNIHFQYGYVAKQKEYLFWFHNYFSELGYCNPKIPSITTQFNKRTRKEEYSIRFHSYTSESFNEIYSLFYKKVDERFIKFVPENIGEFLNPLAIAIWYQDDGSKATNGGGVFCTDSFTKEEVERLQRALKKKFDIGTTLQVRNKEKGQWRLYIPAAEFGKFKELVLPHMLPCFYYKLGL